MEQPFNTRSAVTNACLHAVSAMRDVTREVLQVDSLSVDPDGRHDLASRRSLHEHSSEGDIV